MLKVLCIPSVLPQIMFVNPLEVSIILYRLVSLSDLVLRGGDSIVHNIITMPLAWDQILAILFVVFAPIQVVGPFVALTRGTDQAFCKQLAWRATVFAAIGVLVAASYLTVGWGNHLVSGGNHYGLAALFSCIAAFSFC